MLTGTSVDLENQENVPPGAKEAPKVAGAPGHRLALGLLQANQRRSTQPQVRRFALLTRPGRDARIPGRSRETPPLPLTRHLGALLFSS